MVAPIADIPASTLEHYARQIRITRQDTGEEVPWEPSAEQRAHWRLTSRHQRTNTLKGRQVYITTAQCLEDALFVGRNTARGHLIEAWLVWDTDEKVQEKVAVVADFLGQLGIRHRHAHGAARIEVPRGRSGGRHLRPSVVRGFTAGAKRTGASLTAHLVHCSELPYWYDPAKAWLSLQPAAAFGRLRLETTMAAGVPLARQVWDGPNDYARLFLPVEMHESYRRDPSELLADYEERLRKEGFTRRDSMAWMQWAHRNLAGGDWTELLREYPQTVEHCFNLAEGRWIRCSPRVLEHRFVSIPDGGHLKVFVEPADTSGQCVIGVDTAGAKGRSRHAVGVIDRKDGRLCASYVSGTDTHRELVNVIDYAQRLYSVNAPPRWAVDGTAEGESTIPVAVIESNGPGEATVTMARERGVVLVDVRTTEASGYRGLLAVKARAEAGVLCGPDELVKEADSLRMEQRSEDSSRRWLGLKDLCMACGLAYVHISGAPFEEPEEDQRMDREHFSVEERLRW
jgi:hypothetical protein